MATCSASWRRPAPATRSSSISVRTWSRRARWPASRSSRSRTPWRWASECSCSERDASSDAALEALLHRGLAPLGGGKLLLHLGAVLGDTLDLARGRELLSRQGLALGV